MKVAASRHLAPSAAPGDCLVTITEVTESHQTQEQLRASERRQQALINNLPFMAWLKDVEGRFLAVNLPFSQTANAPIEQILGKTDFDFWRDELASKYWADDREVMRTRCQIRTEEVIHHPEGDRWHETYKTPIIDERGEVVGTAGIAQDITERKLAEQERLKVLEQMQRLERLESLGILAGGIAHDFNNLLGGLFGFMDLARLESQEEGVQELLANAMSAFERAHFVSK